MVVARGVIEPGVNYYQTGDESLVSADRRTTILPFVMAGDETQADENIDAVLKVVQAADGDGGFKVLIAGGASINKDFQDVSESDLQTGEAFLENHHVAVVAAGEGRPLA